MPTKAQAHRSKKLGPKYEGQRAKAAGRREKKLNRYITTVEQHGVPEPRDEDTLKRRETKLRERVVKAESAKEPNANTIANRRSDLDQFLRTNEGVDKTVKNPVGLQKAKDKLQTLKKTGRTK